MMISTIVLLLIVCSSTISQIIKTLPELSIEEELPIGSLVTSLTDKIPNLDQSAEYDLITPISPQLDLFSINHSQHSLIVKNRIDYEQLCVPVTSSQHCTITVSIAVSNAETIVVYLLPIHLININDNFLRFAVNRTVIEIEENDEQWMERSYPLPRATDADGDRITYSIYLQNWQKPDGLFAFDEKNLLLRPLKKFDREAQNIYLLRLVAHNQNDLSIDIIILIKDTNDNAPYCEQNPTVFLIGNVSSLATLLLNVTDVDEGENSQLEFHFVHPLPGFTLDRFNGQIRFDSRTWIRSNQSMLIVNVTDHGKPHRLSTQCFVQIQFANLFRIDFKSDLATVDGQSIFLPIEEIHRSIGQFTIDDRHQQRSCVDCSLNLTSSIPELFTLNDSTFDLYLNMNSILWMRILTNYSHRKENLSLSLTVAVVNFHHPSVVSSKNYSFVLHFNKEKFLLHSNRLFLRLAEHLPLNHRLSIFHVDHPCLNNPSKELTLIDATNTFTIDQQLNLILRKHLNSRQKRIYYFTVQQPATNQTDQEILCAVQVQLFVFDPYSIDDVYPHFSQSFHILAAQNLSQFALPKLPAHVQYASSVPELISVHPVNGSIGIRSSKLRSSSYFDFQLHSIDSHTPSLSGSMAMRIFFGPNKYLPRLIINSTEQSVEIVSSKFLYQIQASDPDLLLNDQMHLLPPAIEYDIYPKTHLEIERYTGRIFLKSVQERKINFTLTMTDFGQPERLQARQHLLFDIKPNESISIPMALLGATLLLLIILLSLLIVVVLCCCCCCSSTARRTPSKPQQANWTNISPTTADTRLIDHEYVAAGTTTTLPPVSSREQRIYPTLSYVHINHESQSERRFVSHSSLDRLCRYSSSEKVSLPRDGQQRLSMTDVNRYLERFEKIYHESPSQQNLHQPRGSVV